MNNNCPGHKDDYSASATTAYRKTVDNRARGMIKQTRKIRDLINEAVDNGDFSITGSDVLLLETKKWLENHGFSVNDGTQYNDPFWIISWDHPSE